MAPEQASGREDLDGRADVWSLGVVMYEALSGTLPHEAPNYNALMVRILTQDVDPLATRKPDLPPKLCQVVDACLRRDRDQRIQGAGDVGRQLDATLNEIKAVRYRSVGRRASDRMQGQFRRRQSDYAGAGNGPGGPMALEAPPPPQRVVVMAAVLGAIFGVSATAILFLLMK